ncbi:hypothetical protein KC19_5G140400 [Ceratodon purpureus]|uniref:Protein kinase domain-containing protein n=1 Tax=Ceratodon purpureus TaxID=3225 RepID=A0A8T0I1B5_CERPU|nr:hypothetical protein KC19_5G140400 [Ceratodon purpureus]
MANHLDLTIDALNVASEPEFVLHVDQALCKRLASDFLIPVRHVLAYHAARMLPETVLERRVQGRPHLLEELHRIAHRARILVERCCEMEWWRILFQQACNSHSEEALDFIEDLQWCMAQIWKIPEPPQIWKIPEPPQILKIPELPQGLQHFKDSFKDCEELDRSELLKKLEHRVSDLEKLTVSVPLAQNDFQLSKFLLERIRVQEESEQIASLDYQKYNREGYSGCPDTMFLGEGAAGSVIKTDFLSISCARKGQNAGSDAQLQEFAKQALKLSKLSHPHVIKLFGFHSKKRLDEPHKGFFLIELMNGNLYNELKKGGDGEKKNLFQICVAVDIMKQIAKGVRYLHENGVSHRDLKCENILVSGLRIPIELANSLYKDYLHIKVADFDQAKILTSNSSDSQIQSKPNVGTTQWRAPECYTEPGKPSIVKVNSKRADSFSFAMTCYELLSVKNNPFDALPINGVTERKKAIQAGTRPPIPRDCPKLLKTLIEDCWQTEAPRRPEFDEICRRLQDVHSVLLTETLSQRTRDGASASLKLQGMVSTIFKHITTSAAIAANKLLEAITPERQAPFMYSGITAAVPQLNKGDPNKEHDTLTATRVVVGLDFGTTHSGVAYATVSNPQDIHTISWPSIEEEVYNCKTLTAIYKSTPNGEWIWGYRARKEYANRFGRGDAQDGQYFGELKQSLTNTVTGSNNHQPVVEYLRKLGDFVLDYLQHYAECPEKESLKMDHLRWCITVPSDWSYEVQSFRKCLEIAGLVRGQAFEIFRESDAAARHCYINWFSSTHLEKGDKICVLDVGSGNVQCVFEDWNDIERTQNTYGATPSSAESLVNEKFYEFIRRKVGSSNGQFLDTDPSVYRSLLDAELEYLKAHPNDTIQIPCCKTNRVASNDMAVTHLGISSSDWEFIFKPLVDKVVSFLREQLQDQKKPTNVKRLFIVGGYARHAYLIKEIKKSFPGFIIDPPLRSPGSAICKGAVALGLMLYSHYQARTQQDSSSNSEGDGKETNLDGGRRDTDSNQHGQPGSSQKFNPSISRSNNAPDCKGKKKVSAEDQLEDSLPEKMLVALDFGTSQMSFAYSRASPPSKIVVCEDHQRRTMDLFYELQDDILCLRSCGQRAKDDCRANRPGVYVSKPKLHVLVNDLEPVPELSLPTGLTINDVISDCLREYGEFILHVLQEKFGESFELQHIQWCLIVPSFWGEKAKLQMRTCMVKAGLLRGAGNVDGSPYPVVTVLEAEAASIAFVPSLSPCKGRRRFMVASIGSGTLDMVVQEWIGESGKMCDMKEVSMGSGGLYGSSCLDFNFLALLSMKMGAWISDYLNQNPCVLNDLLLQWEHIKVNFFDNCEPSPLIFPKTLQDAWRHSEQISTSGQLGESYESLQLTCGDMKMVFEPLVQTVLERIAVQLARTNGVDVLVLAGGFAVSPYLSMRVKDRFLDKELSGTSSVIRDLVRLDDNHFAMLKGAVNFGLQQKIIRSRVARKTYGLGMSLDFQAGLCSAVEKPDEVERFRIDVERGSCLKVDSCVTSVHKFSARGQKTMKFSLYSSVESYPRYTEEESVTKEWDFVVDISGSETFDGERQIEIILYYGRSAIEVEAKGVDFGDGILLPVTFVAGAVSERNAAEVATVARKTYGIGALRTLEKWDLPKHAKHVDEEDLCDFSFIPFIRKGTRLDYFASRTLFPIHSKQKYLPFFLYSSSETSPVYVTDDVVVEEAALEIDIDKGLNVDKDREVSVRMWFSGTDIKISAVALNFANPKDRNLSIRLRDGNWETQVTLNLARHLRVVPLQSKTLNLARPLGVIPLQSTTLLSGIVPDPRVTRTDGDRCIFKDEAQDLIGDDKWQDLEEFAIKVNKQHQALEEVQDEVSFPPDDDQPVDLTTVDSNESNSIRLDPEKLDKSTMYIVNQIEKNHRKTQREMNHRFDAVDDSLDKHLMLSKKISEQVEENTKLQRKLFLDISRNIEKVMDFSIHLQQCRVPRLMYFTDADNMTRLVTSFVPGLKSVQVHLMCEHIEGVHLVSKQKGCKLRYTSEDFQSALPYVIWGVRAISLLVKIGGIAIGAGVGSFVEGAETELIKALASSIPLNAVSSNVDEGCVSRAVLPKEIQKVAEQWLVDFLSGKSIPDLFDLHRIRYTSGSKRLAWVCGEHKREGERDKTMEIVPA